jgi:hypothetical protein
MDSLQDSTFMAALADLPDPRKRRGTTLAQSALACKRNEIPAVPLLLAGRDLTDTLTTIVDPLSSTRDSPLIRASSDA